MTTKSLAIFSLNGAGKKTLIGSLIYKVFSMDDLGGDNMAQLKVST